MEGFYRGSGNDVDTLATSAREMSDLIRLKIKQEKGQRIFRPIWSDELKPIEPGCEIFVGRLPRDALEGELVPIFASLGQIFECRLMMDFSGLTRGFCYVTYSTKEMADSAVEFLHGLRIRPNGEKIYCYHSLDNRRLYLEGIPTDRSTVEIEFAIRNRIPGVCRVILYNSPGYIKLGVGFIEFSNHRFAANCRKNFWPSKLKLWGVSIFLEWAVPLLNHTKNNLLLIKNLSGFLTKTALIKELLKILPEDISMTDVYKRYNYAIIQFVFQKDANNAVQLLRGKTIAGNVIIPKFFDVTGEGEKELMLELQMCEHYEKSHNGNNNKKSNGSLNMVPQHPKQLAGYNFLQNCEHFEGIQF